VLGILKKCVVPENVHSPHERDLPYNPPHPVWKFEYPHPPWKFQSLLGAGGSMNIFWSYTISSMFT